jgi:hypothetical protein
MTIHGKDIHEKCLKDKEKLHTKVAELFDHYSDDPHLITQTMTHLFSKPIQYILAMDRDAIHCWIKSVEEARLTRMHAESVTKGSILQFLRPRKAQEIEPKQPESLTSHQDKSPVASEVSTCTKKLSNPHQPSSPTLKQASTFSPENSKRSLLASQIRQKSIRHNPVISGIPKRDRKVRRKCDKPQNTIQKYVRRTACRRQADSDAVPRDFSGTFLSTAP